MDSYNQKIKFPKNNSKFYKELDKEVKTLVTKDVLTKATILLHVKLFFYAFIYLGSYVLIYTELVSSSFPLLILNYCMFGLFGILLAFNASHDAVHNTLFKNKRANTIAHYIIFNLQGVNATLWKKRHVYSHHLFPNVDDCDADIDDNPFMRLSIAHKRKKVHKYQHIYALFVYSMYTLHWILIKDFVYLRKKRVANMNNLNYSKAFVFETIFLKLLYFILVIGLPVLLTDISFANILIAFFIMHLFISIFFVLTLIISHLTLETVFPVANKEGYLPFDYYKHQLLVSLDYHPTNKLANWIFGGFNSHSAHHLFPKLPHTLYTVITPLIQEATIKHKLPYNKLSIGKAIRSHMLYLKKIGGEGDNR